jgi:hypothetical protein
VAPVFQHVSAVVDAAVSPVAEIIHEFFNPGATLRVNAAAEPEPFTIEAFGFEYRPIAGPVAALVQDPVDIRGPADRPHYGIGGFFLYVPQGEKSPVLAAPAELEIRWADAQVASFDENSLAIYEWNEDRVDWDFIGGAVDSDNNAITASVNRLGLYTVAPPMPAGTVTLTRDAIAGGTPQDPTTIVNYTSDPIRLNTGALVPDGTFFTVRTYRSGRSNLTPFGLVTTADEDPLTDGIQVRSMDGIIHFTAEYPGSAGRALVLVTAVEGTALAQEEIDYP